MLARKTFIHMPTKAARKTLEDLVKAHAQSEAATVAKTRLAKLK